MNWPTSQDYNEAIQSPQSSFADPALKSGEVVVNAIGLPVPRSGNFADVYQFKGGDGKTWALKCFTRKVAGLQERYAKIDEHIGKANFPFTVGFNYLSEGVRFRGQWFPVLKMEWVEGFTLNEFVRDNAGKPKYLQALLQMWEKLTARLRDANFAHADLQHGNVLLVPGDLQNTLGLRLIDYDGMWVPALAEHHSGEIGHPNFQHPLRLRDRLYNADADRFPHLVIASALRATALGGRALWDRFDNGDNLLFKEADLRDPANAPVFKALWELNDDVLCALLGKLALAAREPMRKTPWLDDVMTDPDGVRLNDEEEKKVMHLLGVGPHFSAGKTAAAAVMAPVASQFADLDVNDGPVEQRPAVKRAEGKTSKKAKQPVKEARAKKLLPYYIGGGAAAVAVIAIVIALMSGGGKPKQTELAKSIEKVEQPKTRPPAKEDVGAPKTTEPLKKEPTLEAKKDPPTEAKKDPPVEAKQNPPEAKIDPPVEAKKDPPPANDPQGFVPGTVSSRVPVIRVAALPGSNNVLYARKDDKSVHQTFHDLKKTQVVGVHEADVRAIACAPDGLKFVSGGEDNAVRVGTIGAYKQLHLLKEHTKPVIACAVSPDSQRAVSIGEDNLLCEWNIIDGKLIKKSPIPASSAVAFLPDGKSVLIGSVNESAFVYDLAARQRVKDLPGHVGNVRAVCVSADGKWAITGGDDALIRVWSMPEFTAKLSISRHRGPIVGLAMSPNGQLVVSAGEDKQVFTHELPFGRHIATTSIGSPVYDLVVPSTGAYAVVGFGAAEGPGGIRFHRAELGGALLAKKGPPPDDSPPIVKKGIVIDGPAQLKEIGKFNLRMVNSCLDISGDGGQIAVGAQGNKIEVYRVSDASLLNTLNGAQIPLSYATFLPLENKIAFGGGSNVQFYDPTTKRNSGTGFSKGAPHVVKKIPVVAKDQTVLVPNGSGFGIMSAAEERVISQNPIRLASQDTMVAACCSEDGQCVLALTDQGDVFTKVGAGPQMQLLGNYPKANSADLTPDGKQFVIGYDPFLVAYDSASGKPAVTYEGRPGFVRQACYMNGGRQTISAHGNGFVRLWDAQTGKMLQEIKLPGATVQVAVSADGRYAVTATVNSDVIHVWRLEGGGTGPMVPGKDGPLATSAELPDRVVAAFYSVDGKRIYAASKSGSIHVLDPMTLAETQKYSLGDRRIVHAVAAPRTVVAGPGPPKEWLYVLDDRKRVLVVDPEKGAVTKTLPTDAQLNDPNEFPNYYLTVAPDARTLLVLGRTGGSTGVRWDLKTNVETKYAPLERRPFGNANGTHVLGFSANGLVGAAATATKLLVWNAKTGLDVAMFDFQFAHYLTIVTEANAVVAAGTNHSVAWNYLTGKEIWNETNVPPRYGLQAIPKSKRLAYTTQSDLVIRDGTKGEEVVRWRLPDDGTLVASADGKYLVSFGRNDKKLRLWAVPVAAKKP
jgi:WD40 repeat protein